MVGNKVENRHNLLLVVKREQRIRNHGMSEHKNEQTLGNELVYFHSKWIVTETKTRVGIGLEVQVGLT